MPSSMVKVLPHVMRNINEFNIPAGDTAGYEILYFGVNLILMFDYRLSFDIELKSSEEEDDASSSNNSNNKVEVLIISRKDVSAWKSKDSSPTQDIKLHYSNSGQKINDIFEPSVSDAYAFILSNRYFHVNNNTKKVDVTLTHTWQQEIKEQHLKDRP
jgi:hypothetical protein